MSIAVIGLNHKTAPVEIRERLALNGEQVLEALAGLTERFADAEFVLLSTCNRVELYCAHPNEVELDPPAYFDFLANWRDLKVEQFQEGLYCHADKEGVGHLLAVASSLDSMVVGESQIIGQVKDSYHLACQAGATGKILNRLFHAAFATSKEVYTNTSISRRRVSVAGVAVGLARQLFADLTKARVAVIGAGDMGELLIRHFQDMGCRHITVVNRTQARAHETADKYHIAAAGWPSLETTLAEADIVVAAATAEHYLFEPKMCRKLMAKRRKRALLLIDIAVPRNFDPAVNDIDDIYLYSIDDLAQVVEANLQARQDDSRLAGAIIQENILDFMDWYEIRDIGPLLGQMKDKFNEIGRKELEIFLDATPELADEIKPKIDKLVNRLLNKQMHCLIHNLNFMAKDQDPHQVAQLIRSIIDHPQDRPSTDAKE